MAIINTIETVLKDDPKGEYRSFVLSPHFRKAFGNCRLSTAFNINQSNRELIELAFISEVYNIEPNELIRVLPHSGRRLGLDLSQPFPSAREISNFKRQHEWIKFLETSSINTYKNAIAYDPNKVFPDMVIPDNLSITTPARLVSDLLAVNSGVALGDHHGDVCITDFLQEQMPTLQVHGLRTLYFEMIESHHQQSLNEYCATGNLDILKEIIDNSWDRKGDGNMRKEYIAVLESARNAGIRIAAIDREEMGNRFHDSNPHWIDIIEKDRENRPCDEKFIVFGGHYHFCDSPPNQCFPIMSVSKQLGIPSIEFRAGSDREKSVISGESSNQNDFVVTLLSDTNSLVSQTNPTAPGILVQPSLTK